MQILDWLCERDDGLAHLTDGEREAAISFALLWMYFEARLLNTRASPTTLKALVSCLEQAKQALDGEPITSCYDYFRQRYWDSQGPSQYFSGLKMPADLANEVLASLATTPSPREKLETCLLIALRYRNNLFHGTKWLYGLEGQQSNFEHAVLLLRAVIGLDDKRQGL